MNWQLFSKLRFYASVGIALVGLSAASTLISPSTSVAQVPTNAEIKDSMKEEIKRQLTELEVKEVKLKADVGDDHPSLVGLRAQIAALKALQARDEATKARGAAVRTAESALRRARAAVDGQLAEVTGDVITENVLGTTSRVVVRELPDGSLAREVTTTNSDEPGVLALPMQGQRISTVTVAGNQDLRELQKVIEKLKSKDASDEDKKAAREKIEKKLGEQFDEDLKQREKQVEELEKQLATLKEQIGKRRDAKNRLIELRMELLMNESEGLGFPNAWQTSARHGLTSTIGPYSLPASTIRVPGLSILPPAATAPVPPLPPAPGVAPVAPAAPALPVLPAAPIDEVKS